MTLHTERLTLEPLGPQYLLSAHEYASDLESTKYMVHLPNYDINETKSFLEKVQAEWQKYYPDYYEYAILFNSTHIGAVSISLDKENESGELGWIINKNYWGNGYATEAARKIMSYAINELNVKKFIAHCDSENISSYRVMQKLGLSFVSKSNGRRNKSSNKDSEDLMYSLENI